MHQEQARAREGLRAAILSAFPNRGREIWQEFAAAMPKPRQELIDSAELILPKPYGSNHLLRVEGEFGLSFVCMKPGRCTSLHYHRERRELFCVREGSLELTRGARTQRFGQLEHACSTPLEPHRLSNGGEEDLEILEVFCPALLDDKVRLADVYHRELGEVPHNL